MNLYKNTLKIVIIVIKTLSYHTKMNGFAFHVFTV